ncbi:MAG: PPC domain-containing protein, partial [Bacteroidota bacterium]
MKKPLLILLLGFFLAFYAKADTEPGNNSPIGTPDVLSVGGSQPGSIGPADNDDYYQLTTTADGNLTISLSNNNDAYTYIYLYDSNGATQLGSTSGSALGGIQFTSNGLAAGTYYVRVFGTDLTNYSVSSSLATVPVANDTEPNNTPGTALTIAVNTSTTGHIAHRYNGGTFDQDDYYSVTTTADGNLTVSLTNTNNQYTYIYLYDNDGATQLGATSGSAGLGISFTASGLAAGSYYVRVYGASDYTGYTLSTSLDVVPVVNDPEPNNTVAQATPLPINTNVTGHIGHRINGGTYDLNDYYLINTTSDGNVTVSLNNTNNQFTYIYIYDNDGITQLGATSGSAGSGISFTAYGLAAGSYYVLVFGSSAYTGYTLNATLTPDPIVNDPNNNNHFANAPSFAQNDSITGHVGFRNNGGTYDTDDYFSFYSNGDYDITITLRNDNDQYTYIYLYDTDTATQLGATSGSALNGISFTTTGLAAGTYYIRVYGSSAYTGYVLKNSYTANPIPANVEPNNTAATATPTAYNSIDQGHIGYRHPGGTFDNYDFYSFTTPVDGNITLSLTNNNNAYNYIYLYDSDGVTQLGSTSGSAQAGISVSTNGLAAGNYYAIVYSTAYSGYTLTKTLTPTPFTADTEPNATLATALTMAPNSSLNGHIAHRYNGGSYDDYDWYKIVTTVDGDISLNLTNDNNAYNYIYLYDSDAATQLASTSGNAQAGISVGRAGLAAGTYYAIVYGGGGSFSGYTLTNTVTAAPYQNDVESNNSFVSASVLNNNASKKGHIGYRFNGGAIDDYDYWKVTMNATDSMRIDLSFTNSNYAYVYFYNAALNQLYAQSGSGGSYSVFFNSLPAGDYYLVVYATAHNSYKVDNFYYPCDPSASAITAGGPTTFCAGLNVALNSVNAYNSYSWSTGATTGSISATSTGDYTLTAFDFDGCPHVSNTIHVNVNPAPTPSITHGTPTTFCSGGSVTLSTGVFSSYLWSTGATSQSIVVNSTGIYTVTVTNANGCTGVSASESVNVNANPATPVITPSGSLSFCSNSNINLTSTAATSYAWST